MRRFLLTGLLFLVGALVATVAVFLVIRSYSLPNTIAEIKDSVGVTVQESVLGTEEVGGQTGVSSTSAIAEGGIPLRDVSFNDAQKKALTAAQIDIETFVISREMLGCAEDAIGTERVTALQKGESPSLIEIGKLLPCLKS